MKRAFSIFLFLAFIFFMSCSGALSGFRSSSTKKISKAPYYTGSAKTLEGTIGHFPVEMDVRLYNDFFENNRRDELTPVINAMNEYVDSFNVSKPLIYIDLDPDKAPDIYVGNRNAFNSPAPGSDLGDISETQEMVIYQQDPSKAWKDSLLAVSAKENVENFIYITIGFSEYFLRMKNLLGKKELQIGTGYTQAAPWLSDLDTPAEVLHVTGVLLDKNGKILRCGSEGIIAKQTGFWSSVFDLQDMIDEAELKNVLENEKRQDLDGEPLAWQVALNNLVAQLLEKEDMIIQ